MESIEDIRKHMDKISENNHRNASSFVWFLIVVIVFLFGIILGHLSTKKVIQTEFREIESTPKLELLFEVWNKIQSDYVEKEVDEQEMLYGTVKGLVTSLGDKYSVFLSPSEVEEYNNDNAGIFEGIGTTLRFDGDYTVIETPITGFPAHRAGLMPRDVILEVDGEDMTRKSAQYVATKILGEVGTQVHIKIYRESENEFYEFDISRERIDFDNIELRHLGNGIYQIIVHKFTEDSLNVFKKDWTEITNSINSPKGIILDLRNNPGGYVEGAEYILNEFLPKNTVLYIEEDRDGNQRITKSNKTGKFKDVKMVVLINSGSASASEIVAGALRDNDRTILVGQETLGKGVEQKVINLSDGSELHLVFKKWLTPNGQNVTFEDSIRPDIEVEYSTENFKNNEDPQLDKALEVLQSN